MIFQLGSLNTTALIVPDLYIQIVPPQIAFLNGVPTNIEAVVGTASWGKKNAPVTIGSMADYEREFGPIKARKYDLGTATAVAVLQGASNFRCIRATDGTDVAASVIVTDGAGSPANGFVLTMKNTGSLGNSCVLTLDGGTSSTSGTPTFRVSLAFPGRVTESFDNIGGTGQAIWNNIIAAINNGNSILRGPSDIAVASVPVSNRSSVAPTIPQTFSPTGGTDGEISGGNATVIKTALVGVDTQPRKGMYAIRGTGASVAVLADLDDSTTWTEQSAFGLAEGVYMIGAGPAGDTISNAVTTKKGIGLDSYAFKLMLGDWVYWSDNVNGQLRLVSPASFAAGKLVALAPQESSLNKILYGVVGTQRTLANLRYSGAELQQLAQGGIDVITNPVPGGDYFGVRFGHNSSSDSSRWGDNYTRLINYIAATFNAGMGKFVGRLQTPDQRLECKTALDTFFANMWQQGQIGNADGTIPYFVKLDDDNNPPSRVALGYEQADLKVQFLSVVEKLLLNVQGGQTVSIERVQ